MLERERHRMILKLLGERSIISVSELVELLGASEASVRRDINAMAERGELRRVRGGAESGTGALAANARRKGRHRLLSQATQAHPE